MGIRSHLVADLYGPAMNRPSSCNPQFAAKWTMIEPSVLFTLACAAGNLPLAKHASHWIPTSHMFSGIALAVLSLRVNILGWIEVAFVLHKEPFTDLYAIVMSNTAQTEAMAYIKAWFTRLGF